VPIKNALNIGVVCGEHSGDRLGAGLIKEIKKNSDINLYGIGGPKLEELGFESEFDFSEINIMGLVQPLINYRKLSKLRSSLIKLFIEKEIDLFIGIDSPDFNIGIHKALKNNHDNRNIQVVSPSVWGWRQNRVKPINKYIDLTLCLFNFEHNFYKKIGHNSLQLGHPFSQLKKFSNDAVLKKHNLEANKKYISVLPGSRESEIKYMLPTYIEFIKDHSLENKDYIYLVPAADRKLMESIKKSFDGLKLPVVIKENAMREFLSISELSIVTSGTATLESAILECPTIICYKTNFINYSIISRMLKVNNIGLPNLLLGKSYFVELLQNNFTKENIKQAIKDTLLLKDSPADIAETLREMLIGVGYSKAAQEITLA
jgi:lipid-A-disaccharide synthase